MRTLSLFNDNITLAISDIRDGNMRYFDSEKFTETEPNVIAYQSKLCSQIKLSPSHTARIRTIYDDRKNFTDYRKVTSTNIANFSIINSEVNIPVTDGLVTEDERIGFLLPLADCLGIVVFDESKHTFGLLHAGRHNIEQNGPYKFIEYFCETFDSNPKNLKVYLSPCARNYQITKLDNKKLPDAAIEQLLSAGILSENITDSKTDTATNPNYPSCSTGDSTSRFAIAVKQKNYSVV